jgi:CxxC-x17-CxxC domain-containing protein
LDFQDKNMVCFDCGAAYIFSVDEQKAFQAKGHTHPPKRCPSCRAVRAARRPAQPASEPQLPSFSAPKQLFNVTCSSCGKETQVPFEPRAGRPVYCSDCYHKVRMSKN